MSRNLTDVVTGEKIALTYQSGDVNWKLLNPLTSRRKHWKWVLTHCHESECVPWF